MERQTEKTREKFLLNETKGQTSGHVNCSILQYYMVLKQSEKEAIGSICFLTGPVTFLENILVLVIIARSARLRARPSYMFIASLALADTFASCFFTSSFLDFHLNSNNYDCNNPNIFLFKLGGVTMSFTGSVGSLLLTALDRYLCFYQASNYKVLLTRRKANLAIVVLWCVTILISFLPLMGWRCTTVLNPPCSYIFPYVDYRYMASWACLQLLVLFHIIVAYGLILWKARRHEAAMGEPQQGKIHTSRMRMDIQLAQTFSLIVLVLVVCWLPVLVLMMVDASRSLTKYQRRVFAFCSTLCLVNSCVNPLLYALRCRELRRELLVLIRCFNTCRKTSVDDQGKEMHCRNPKQNKDPGLKNVNQETVSESVDWDQKSM